MKIREYKAGDKFGVEKIFLKYWTDPEFLDELSDNLDNYIYGDLEEVPTPHG